MPTEVNAAAPPVVADKRSRSGQGHKAQATADAAAELEDGRIGSGTPQLLERTFALLSLFAPDRPEWTTTELSSVSGLPVPTAHRIVVALQRHDFLARDPHTKRFRLGPAAIALGRAALSSADLPTVAGKLLPALTAKTEETSLLTVLDDSGTTSVCLLRVESPHPLRLSVQPGRHLALHAGASQKVLLAYLPESERERIAQMPLEKFCRRTIDTTEELLAEIERIRQQGWACSFEETNAGVWGIAVALIDSAGHSVAAVGVAGPQVRASQAGVEQCVRATAEAAGEIATRLGLESSCERDVAVSARDIPKGLRG